jgi:hypothetical protein
VLKVQVLQYHLESAAVIFPFSCIQVVSSTVVLNSMSVPQTILHIY